MGPAVAWTHPTSPAWAAVAKLAARQTLCARPDAWLHQRRTREWTIRPPSGGNGLWSFGPSYRELMAERLVTERLVLRQWTADDADAALSSYGDAEVAHWLAPAMDRVGDEAAMRVVLQQWMAEDERMLTPGGRWAIELRHDGRVIGGATLLPLPPDDEYEIGWQLRRDVWGHGYATETGRALAGRAFEQGLEQVIAVVRPTNTRAISTVRRIGMEWTGETEKYHHLRLQVYRLRPADLGASAA